MIQINCILKNSTFSKEDNCYYIKFKSKIITIPDFSTMFCFLCEDLKEGMSWIDLDEFAHIQTKPYDNI